MMTPIKITSLLLAATLLLPVPVFAQARRDNDNKPDVPVIRVTGQAEVSAEPDEAIFEVGAEIRDASSSKAMAEVARISDRLEAALKALNIPKEDIETTQLSLNQQMEPIPSNEQNKDDALRQGLRRVFVATHILQVKVGQSRFAQIGEILDAAMKAGANHVGNITFGIKDETAIRKEGLAKAVKSARSKADVMADAAGVSIKGLLMLAEGGAPRPYEDSGMAMRSFAAAAPSPAPPTEIKRTYTVTADYAINP
jgi:uncharacterized protein YggE